MQQKGLSFSPMIKFDAFQMEIDLERLFRNVRLKTHFAEIPPFENRGNAVEALELGDNNTLTLGELGLRLKSSYCPPKNNHPVETFINWVKRDMEQLNN